MVRAVSVSVRGCLVRQRGLTPACCSIAIGDEVMALERESGIPIVTV